MVEEIILSCSVNWYHSMYGPLEFCQKNRQELNGLANNLVVRCAGILSIKCGVDISQLQEAASDIVLCCTKALNILTAFLRIFKPFNLNFILSTYRDLI